MARVDLFLWLKHYKFSLDSYFTAMHFRDKSTFHFWMLKLIVPLIVHSLIKGDVAFVCLPVVLIYWKHFMFMVLYLVLSLSVLNERDIQCFDKVHLMEIKSKQFLSFFSKACLVCKTELKLNLKLVSFFLT